MGEIYIGCGFIRGKLSGIYYDILGRVGGRLAVGRSHRRVTAGWLLEYHITVITLSKNDMSKKSFFCVTHN